MLIYCRLLRSHTWIIYFNKINGIQFSEISGINVSERSVEIQLEMGSVFISGKGNVIESRDTYVWRYDNQNMLG